MLFNFLLFRNIFVVAILKMSQEGSASHKFRVNIVQMLILWAFRKKIINSEYRIPFITNYLSNKGK